MEIFLACLLFAVGIVFIVKGGDFFVDAASWIAEVSGIPKFIIGATIVSLATTLPELLVSLFAAVQGSVDMAIGNAVGSVTANVGLIMGISVVCIPAAMKRKKIAFKSIMMVCSIALLWLFSIGGKLGLLPSILMLLIFVVFIIENVVSAKKSMVGDKEEKEPQTKKVVVTNIGKFIIGAAGIVAGAQLLVNNGKILAKAIGIPEAIIGVTVIAIGTSLPELVTTITAIKKKQASLSIGNIIGANVIDLTLIMPLCALISGGGLPVSQQSIMLDLPACLFVILIAIVPTLISQKFRRWQGVAMLVTYVVYLVLLCVFFL
jgi:cation:H+ antiporter